jgi:uncharacterized membrane protein YbhN (UPF0104 family)
MQATQEPIAEQATNSLESDTHRLRTGIIWTVVLLGLALAVGLAVPDLRGVLDRATNANLGWLGLAVALEIASCLGYVVVVRLVLRRGPARELRWLAWAEMAFGAVVPVGGAGGLAVGAWAMRAWGASWERIANRSAVLFLLTSAVNTIVLAIAGIGVAVGLGGHLDGLTYGLLPAAIALGGIALFLSLPRIARRRLPHGRGPLAFVFRRAASWVNDTEAIAWKPDWRLLGAIGYLLFDIAVLWACLRSVGITAPVFALVVGYQIGYLSNLLPIPGAVGVLEGGLLGALLLYGLPAAPTAAAVVLYHAIALWIPTLGGTVGFVRLRGAVARQHAIRPAVPDVLVADEQLSDLAA